jgi:hypothetical protein
MAIVFDSPKDRFGIQAAGSALAEALMQNALERNQLNAGMQRDLFQDQLATNRQQLAQQRQLELQQRFGPLLGETLSIAYDSNSTPQQKSAALQGYLSAGGQLSDVQAAYKDLAQQNQTQGILNQLGIGGGMNPQLIQQNQNSQLQAAQQMGRPEVIDVNRRETIENGNFFETIDENTAIALSASPNPQLAGIGKAAVEAKKLQQSRFEADRKYESQRSLPYLRQIDDQRAAVENKLRAAQQLDAALAEGDTGGFSVNNIARIFGRPELLNQSGAQLVGAVKELLVSNIGRVGSRPNQWIEQQISLALPDLGKSKVANQTLAEAVKGEVELANKRIQLTDQISAQDQQQLGYVKGDIASRVDQAIKPYADQINKRAAYRMRELYEEEKGVSYLRKNLMKKVPEGTPITKSMARLFMEKYNNNAAQAIDNAKKLGYTVYSTAEVREVQ